MRAMRFAELAMSTWYGQMTPHNLFSLCQKCIGPSLYMYIDAQGAEPSPLRPVSGASVASHLV